MLNKKQRFAQQLSQLLDYHLAYFISELIVDNNIYFTVSRDRKTKLGDYRYSPQTHKHSISVNVGLEKSEFFITALHEFAHFYAFKKFGRKIKPHGDEWKNEYRIILHKSLELQGVDQSMKSVILKEIKKPTVAHRKPLQKKALNSGEYYLNDIADGNVFQFRERTFKRLELRRTRYFCQCVDTKRLFTIHKDAIVKLVN